LRGEEDLPIVLVHGTMGKSEDWSQVVEELSNSRSVIRPNYVERATETNSTNELAIRDLADEVVAAVRAEGKQRFDLGWRFPRSGSCHMHCGRVSGDGSVACARIGFQPWRGPADEFAVQTVASPSEHRQDRIHKNSWW
jgi:hypothetical protein